MAYMLYINPWTYISDNVMPYCKTHTETVVAVVVAGVSIEVEWTCIGIVIVASTFEKRIIVAVVNAHKIRVRSGISPCFSLSFAQTKSILMF